MKMLRRSKSMTAPSTALTDLGDGMILHPTREAGPESIDGSGRESGSAVTRALLAALADLETSLRASHDALLARDVARLEFLTQEQASLSSQIVSLLRELQACEEGNVPQREAIQGSGARLASSLRFAATRVLRLGRVQCVVLDRMRGLLRVTQNLAAGPQAGYGPNSSQPNIPVERNPRARTEA
jgi:hypothetical protein